MYLEPVSEKKTGNTAEVNNPANEAEMDEETLLSDQDSVSLLQDLPAPQSRTAAEDMAVTNSGSHAANTEIRKKLELNRQKRNKPEISRGQAPTAGYAASSSLSAKVPKKHLLHKRNSMGETLLHKACKKSDLAQVRVLLKAGVGVNIEDYAGWTALHEACTAGDKSVVEELLRAGANINARSCDGVTPLHDAVSAGHYQVVKVLLENGSNTSDKNVGGLSAFDMAEEEEMRNLLSSFQTSTCREPAACRAPDIHPREAGAASTEPADVQLRQNKGRDKPFTALSCTVILEDISRKQEEILTSPLTNLKDLERYKEVLLDTKNVLTDVLVNQRLEKDTLSHKLRTVPVYFHERVLKSNVLALASNQRKLVKLLQNQLELEKAYITAKANISSQSLNHQGRGSPFNQQESLLTDHNSADGNSTGTKNYITNIKGNTAEVNNPANEAEMDEETLLSDQDSVSLLQDLPASQSRTVAKDKAVTNSGSHAANTEIRKRLELNRQKRNKLKINRGQAPTAGCAASSSLSANVPKKSQLYKRNSMGETLLHKACQKRDLAQVRMLLKAGVGVNIEDYAGWTALHDASAAADKSVVEELLRAGANVNARSCDGVTPLLNAVSAGHYQVVKLLLENGSNPSDGNLSALDIAEEGGMKDLLRKFQTSSEGQGKPCKGSAPCGEPGSKHRTVTNFNQRGVGDEGGGNTHAKQKPSMIRLQDGVRCDRDGSTQQELSPEPVSQLQLLRNIKVVHLMDPDEFTPSALMDYYWDKLLKQNSQEFDDWETPL